MEISWKTVLHTKALLGHISKMSSYAKCLEYPYFLWNDRVYRTSDEKDMNCILEDGNFVHLLTEKK